MRGKEGRVPQSPRYLQIADDVRRRIESGEFAADTPLPTESGLQLEYQASRNTIREAIKLLVQQHLVQTKAGRGTFITDEIVRFVTVLSTDPRIGHDGGEEAATYPALVCEQGRKAAARTLEVQVLRCPEQIAERLQIECDALVVSRQQERCIDSVVWSLQTSYYPQKWVALGAGGLLEPADIGDGTVNYLAEAIGLKQVGYQDLLSARLPNDKERTLFNLSHHHTVLEVCRTSFAEDGTPIRVTVTVFPSDRNQLAYDYGAVPGRREVPAQL
jgi:GntR family transcriptional regulator